MDLMRKQQGMTTGGMLLTVLAVIFAATVVMKLFPIYLDNYSIKSILESLDREPEIASYSPKQLKNKIDKHFQTNMIRDIRMQDVKTKRENGMLVVDIDYERRVDLIGNIDLVVTFENNWTTQAR